MRKIVLGNVGPIPRMQNSGPRLKVSCRSMCSWLEWFSYQLVGEVYMINSMLKDSRLNWSVTESSNSGSLIKYLVWSDFIRPVKLSQLNEVWNRLTRSGWVERVMKQLSRSDIWIATSIERWAWFMGLESKTQTRLFAPEIKSSLTEFLVRLGGQNKELDLSWWLCFNF